MKTPTVEMLKKRLYRHPKISVRKLFRHSRTNRGAIRSPDTGIDERQLLGYGVRLVRTALHLPPRRITPQPAPLGEPAGLETHANPALLQRNDQRRHHRAATLTQRNDADTSQQLRLMDGEAESIRNGKQFVGPEFPPLLGKVSRDDANSQSKHRTCKARMEKAERTRTTGGHRKRGGILLSLERHTVLQTSSDVSGG